MQNKVRQERRERRKIGIRKRLTGTTECPRLTVYRSLNHIYAQVIDDSSGRTLVSADSLGVKTSGGNAKGAAEVGKVLGEKAKEAGIARVAFDRNGFRYHGRIKALADAAREAGLKF
ncbi:MAG: 50S ribosomal protein L18 [Phycisphaeraceae bacterium]|nr:50S ribosomal protein L18 [Phycisphaeraceae bacterium]